MNSLAPKLMDKTTKEKYLKNFSFPFCNNVSKYEIVTKVGQGTFGEVFKAKDTASKNSFVALKKVLVDNNLEGFPITTLREIKILEQLRHENIVSLLEIVRTHATQANKFNPSFYLVFEFCDHDLAGLLKNRNVKFHLADIKAMLKQIFNGLYYIHSNKILHRDMKSANVLITKTGVLKLADFGLARAFSFKANGQPNRYTNRVVTLWYRSPELLLGERDYGPPIDLWGAGCIMAEMWTRTPILQGQSEQVQLKLISQLCGSITPEVWPDVKKLELFNTMQMVPNQKRRVVERLKPYVKDSLACDLLDKLLNLDPSKRLNADAALNHDFFWEDPMPSNLAKLFGTFNQHMFEYLAPPKNVTSEQKHDRKGYLATSLESCSSEYHERIF